MTRKTKSIFNALDGGHLDQALFRSQSSGDETEVKDDQAQPKNIPRRRRLLWGGARRSAARGQTRR